MDLNFEGTRPVVQTRSQKRLEAISKSSVSRTSDASESDSDNDDSGDSSGGDEGKKLFSFMKTKEKTDKSIA